MGIFVLIVGVVGVVGGFVLGRRVLQLQGWPSAEATVVERGVGEPEQPTGGARDARFVPKVRYTFEVGGRRYEATGIGLVQESMTADEAARAAAAIPDQVTVRYDPTDPTRAYIKVGSLAFPIAIGVFGLLLVLVGAGMAFGTREVVG